MTYTPPKYPTSIPTYSTDTDDFPPWYDDLDPWTAAKANALRLELCSALTELGTLPKGNFLSIKDRFQAFEKACVLKLLTTFTLINDEINYCPFSYTNATELWDPSNMHSLTTNPSRITPGIPGLYLVFANAYLRDINAEWIYVDQNLVLTRNIPLSLNILQNYSSIDFTATLLSFVSMNTTDYIELASYIEGTTTARWYENYAYLGLLRIA